MFSSVFPNRREAGKLLANRIRDLKPESPIVYAIPRGGVPVAQGICESLGAQMDIAPEPESLETESIEFSSLTADQIQDQKVETIQGHTAIIVDDGMASGLTSVAAAKILRERQAMRIIVASPVASRQALERVKAQGIETCFLNIMDDSKSVADFYEEFEPVRDDEVESIRMKGKRKVSIPQIDQTSQAES